MFFEAAGWERPQWYESNAPLLERVRRPGRRRARPSGTRAGGRRSSTPSTWRCATASAWSTSAPSPIFDIAGPGALAAVQRVAVRQMDVAVGRVVYTPLLTPGGGFRSDLTIMRLGRRARSASSPAARTARRDQQVVHRPPARRTARRSSPTSRRPGRRSACGGRGRATSCRRSTPRRRLARGLPVRHLPDDRDRPLRVLASRISYVGELGWELYVPIEQGAPAVGHALGGRPAARLVPGRHRRLRHDRAAREGLPRLRRRARERVRRRSRPAWPGRKVKDDDFVGKEAYLRHRERGAGRRAVHADRRRPHVAPPASSATCSAASRS